MFLAELIKIFHILIVIGMIIFPFTGIPALLILHITFSISLLIHWAANSDVCSLSVLESQLRGTNRTETFTHQFIAPIYSISENSWNRVIVISTWLLMFYSIYSLTNSPQYKQVSECISALKFPENTSSYQKLKEYLKCIHPLFNLNT